ncbi:hypothetical protein E2320_009530, partial [Naja naja]
MESVKQNSRKKHTSHGMMKVQVLTDDVYTSKFGKVLVVESSHNEPKNGKEFIRFPLRSAKSPPSLEASCKISQTHELFIDLDSIKSPECAHQNCPSDCWKNNFIQIQSSYEREGWKTSRDENLDF